LISLCDETTEVATVDCEEEDEDDEEEVEDEVVAPGNEVVVVDCRVLRERMTLPK
jgi:hypothetical protein